MNYPLTPLQIPKIQWIAWQKCHSKDCFWPKSKPVVKQHCTIHHAQRAGLMEVASKHWWYQLGVSQERGQPKWTNDIGTLPLDTPAGQPTAFRTKVKNQTQHTLEITATSNLIDNESMTVCWSQDTTYYMLWPGNWTPTWCWRDEHELVASETCGMPKPKKTHLE